MRNKLHFNPWIGNNYQTKNKKLMVLGESHYDVKEGIEKNPERSDFTVTMVKEVISKVFIANTNKNLHLLLTGSQKQEKIEKLYQDIIFMNLVQEIMEKKKPKFQIPNEDQFLNGWSLCFKEIQKLEIDNVIVLGTHTFRTLIKQAKTENIEVLEYKKEPKVGRIIPRVVKINLCGKKVSFYFIKHPGSFFSWEKWREYLLCKDENLLIEV